MTSRLRSSSASPWALLVLLAGCASTPPPPPAPPASAVQVQYENAPGAPKDKVNTEYWAGRKDLIHSPAPPKPTELALPPVQRFTLKNGLEVIVVARKELPVVSFGLAVQAGGYDERRDQLGVSDFVAAMLRRGTKTRSADDISNAIDFVGGMLDAQASNESTTAGCSALSKDAKLCLDLLSDILLHPSFPESEMGEVRDEMQAAVAARFDNPHELANAHFENQLFGEQNPAGWVLTAEDVRKITRADLEQFWKTFYRPNRAILAVAGDVDAAKLRAGIEKAFGGWARGDVAAPAYAAPPALNGRHVYFVQRPNSIQSSIAVGNIVVKRSDPRWYELTVANTIYGGAFNSRIVRNIREE
jgi:zinc protease